MASNLGPVQLERAAIIVADCLYLTVPEVAAKHGCSKGTVRNYLAREAADPSFAQLCAKKKSSIAEELRRQGTDWVGAAVQSMRNGLRLMDELFQASRPKPGERPPAGTIREVAGAIKILGDNLIVKAALGGEHPFAAGEGSAAQEASDGDTRPVH